MSLRPMTRYRPTKSSDGEYGYDTTFDSGTRISGEVSWHDAELVLIHRSREDVDMEDVIEAPDGAQYRIVGRSVPTGGGFAEARLERKEQPINPS